LQKRVSMFHRLLSVGRGATCFLAASLRSKRTVIRVGFALVIALLVLSAGEAYRIQRTQSREAMEIYRRHVDQDVVLYQLRRTLWLASISPRDFLINPNSNRVEQYRKQLRELKERIDKLQGEFDRLAVGYECTTQLRQQLSDFWKSLDQLPELATGFNAWQRYDFVQQQVVPRRNAAGDVLREFSDVTQHALRANEAAFEANQREASRRLSALLACSVLLGLLVVWSSLSHSEVLERTAERHHQAVERTREELQMLAGRLMSIQEEERTRLSRELHDEIGQALATMRLEVVRTESVCREKLPEVLDRLARARELAERTVWTVRNMSALLRPSVLDDLGLGPALRSLAEEFSARTDVPCHSSLPEDLPALSDTVATCIYRVVQESLHNCEKHAGAKRVDITLSRFTDSLTVEVSDDGIGFHTPNSGRANRVHLGILGMKERAAGIGGTLEAESAPRSGTRIRLQVPCGLAAPNRDVPLPATVASA